MFVHAYLICIHGKAIIWHMLMIYIYEICKWIVVDFVTMFLHIIQEGQKEQPKVTPKVSIVIKKLQLCFS